MEDQRAYDKIKDSGYPPYLIFNNLSLNDDKYYLHIQIRNVFLDGKTGKKTESVKKFRYVFTKSKLKRSQILGHQLPLLWQNDIKPTKGFVSTPFAFSSKIASKDLSNVQYQVFLLSLNDREDFVIRILSNKTETVGNYIRNILVTDPVGRVVAYKRRGFTSSSVQNQVSVDISALTEVERKFFKLTKDEIAKINSCPYVMVFVDQINDGVFKRTLWLR